MTKADGEPLFKLLPRVSDDKKELMLFRCLKCPEGDRPFTSKTMGMHASIKHHELTFIVDLRNLNKDKESAHGSDN